MAITPIDDTSVAVYTFADLSAVLQNTGSAYTAVTQVFLAADITLTAGINLSTARSAITLDGKDPYDLTGETVHTITESQTSDSGRAIGVRTGGYTMAVTYQNINWVGQNYYGVFFTPGDSTYNNVSITLSRINYTGPQFTYHHAGITRILDCQVNIVKAYSNCEEVGEVCRLEIGGTTAITHTDSADTDSMFWFFGTAPSFTILPDAQVTLNTVMDVYYTWAGEVPFSLSPGASLIVNTKKGFCRDSGNKLASVTIGADSSFRLIQTAPGSGATMHCTGAFTVEEGASVYMQSAFTGANQTLYFYTTAAALQLNNPHSFVIYNQSANAFAFDARTTISMTGQQFNYWSSATLFPAAGTLADTPQYAWWRAAGGVALISGNNTGSASTLASSDFSEEDLQGKPLSNLKLHSARVFAVGELPLHVDDITADGYPVTGTTLADAAVRVTTESDEYTSTANAAGEFSVETDVIPMEAAVKIIANVPFLYSAVVRRSLEPGGLTLSAPETMVFLLNIIAESPSVLYGREDTAWALTVTDSRIHSTPWALYASINGPMTSQVNARHTVPGALVHVDEAVTSLGAAPVLIYQGEANDGTTQVTEIAWEAVKGILLQAVDAPYFNKELYRTDIIWTLVAL